MATYEPVYREIGNRLRQAREEMGLTQEGVAQRLGMTLAAYNRYETAERRIPLAVLIEVASYYGRPAAHFLGEPVSPERLFTALFTQLTDRDRDLIRVMMEQLVDYRRRFEAA